MLKILTLAVVFFASISFNSKANTANGLVLITDRSKASGELRVYIKNTGGDVIHVVTGNLSTMTSGTTIEIAPERHVLVIDRKMVALKESLGDYSVVVLKPNETTYLKRISITQEHGELSYYIKSSWAEMHGVWGGKLQTTF
jgi:hypothetical protein